MKHFLRNNLYYKNLVLHLNMEFLQKMKILASSPLDGQKKKFSGVVQVVQKMSLTPFFDMLNKKLWSFDQIFTFLMIRFFWFFNYPKNRKNHIFKKCNFFNFFSNFIIFAHFLLFFTFFSSKSISFIKILILCCRYTKIVEIYDASGPRKGY